MLNGDDVVSDIEGQRRPNAGADGSEPGQGFGQPSSSRIAQLASIWPMMGGM